MVGKNTPTCVAIFYNRLIYCYLQNFAHTRVQLYQFFKQ